MLLKHLEFKETFSLKLNEAEWRIGDIRIMKGASGMGMNGTKVKRWKRDWIGWYS